MMELRIELDVVCHGCELPFDVTLDCKGPGLRDRNARPNVIIDCPHCERTNVVCFDPSGRVHEVSPLPAAGRVAEPSMN